MMKMVKQMKVKKLYTCEICRSDFAEKESAIQCEKSHKQIETIKDTRYSANMPYPHKVLIKFKDGHEIWFKC